MTTVIGGSSPSITFSDSTTQSTAALPLTGGQLSGNLTFSTGTNGIVFNNSSAAINSTLNDYETGTWTPTLITDGTGATITYSSQLGKFTKIGNIVYVECEIGWTARSGGSGNVLVGGFPFGLTDSAVYGMRLGPFSFVAGTGMPTTPVLGYFTTPSSATAFYLYPTTSNTAVGSAAITGGGGLAFKGFYTCNF